MRKSLLFIFALVFSASITAQDKKPLKEIFQVRGYVKYMNTASFLDLDTIITQNLIHNRINFKGYLNDNLTLGLELRNRIFYGEAIKLNPYFGDQVDVDNGLVDMSFLLVDKGSMVFHSTIDRAYVDYAKEKWELRVGRQRINWGMNLAWNPNDLFNTYNLIDFDYEERPGADAVRFQYFTGDLSSMEVAVKPGNGIDSSVIAAMYKFNKWQYDFQFIGANFYEDVALGMGWAGNIKDGGFKGEATYFHPKESFSDTSGVLSASATFDLTFKNGMYVNAAALLNSAGVNDPSAMGQLQFMSGNLSAKSLMPSKWTYFTQVSGAFSPLIGGGMTVLYAQGLNVLFFMPSVSYSIKENWDINLVGQSAFGEVQNQFRSTGTGIFLRLKFSY